MKPLFALLPSGSYVALHLCHFFCTMPSDNDETPGAWDVIGTRPGEEDMTILCTVDGTEDNEAVAKTFLRALVGSLGSFDRPGGILDISVALEAFLKGYSGVER